MGTLIGHVLPGSFFLLFAIWRMIQIVRRLQIINHLKRKNRLACADDFAYVTSATYPCCIGRMARWPVEGLLKVTVTGIGMAGELWASTDYGKAGKITVMGDVQHVTMYSLFCISGLVDLLRWKQVAACPPGMDFIALANAFVGELLLFSHHLYNRVELDVLVHTLLLYVIAANILSVIAEYANDESVIASLSTTYFLFVQGTWFVQVGIILYEPSAVEMQGFVRLSHSDQYSVAVMLFTWHLIGSFVLLLVFYVFLRLTFDRRCCRPSKTEVWEDVIGRVAGPKISIVGCD